MRNTCIALILLFSFVRIGLAQWEWQFPYPQGNELNDFIVTDTGSHAFAVGDYGSIIYTTDFGYTWNFENSLTTKHLHAVHFINSTTGFIAGDSGLIMKYNAGTWQQMTSGTFYHIRDLDFRSEETGIAVGYKGLVLKYSDSAWQEVNSGTTKDLHSVRYASDQVIVAVGNDGKVIRSANGGASWNAVNTPTDQNIYDISFSTPAICYAGGNAGLIMKSVDAGATWTLINANIEHDVYGVSFWNENSGLFCGETGRILRTLDGAGSFELFNIDASVKFNEGLYVSGSSKNDSTSLTGMLACGVNGIIVNVSDDTTFYVTGMNRSLNSVAFTNSTGFAVGGHPFQNKPLMLRTANGSKWESALPDTIKQYLSDITFVDDSMGYIAGFGGKIYRTTNGGTDWVPVESNTLEARLTSISASLINDSVMLGWVAGFNGALLTNTSGDTVWETIETPSERHLFGLRFYNPYNGFALGEQGTLLKISKPTTLIYVNDVVTGVNVALYDMAFKNDTTAFVVGFNGSIFKFNYKTYTEFEPVASGVTAQLNEIRFPHPDTGYIVGEGGLVLKSTDGGETWLPLYTRTDNNLRTLYFKNGQTGYVIGSGGTILYTNNGGGPVILPGIEEELSEENPVHLFPNPNSGRFTISCAINTSQQVSAVLYDLAGNPLKQLFSDKPGPGTLTRQIDVSGVKRGVYIVVIRLDEGMYTEKVVIMR